MKTKRRESFLKAVFFVLYLAVLSAGILASRMFALPERAPVSSELAWKEGVKELLPAHDNSPLKDVFSLDGREVFPAFQIKAHEDDEGQLLEFFDLKGVAFRVEGKGPYGSYDLLLGIDTEGRVKGVRLIRQNEPRGVSLAVEKSAAFWESFKDKSREDLSLLMDGGKIVPVLGAVEVSRRYTEAIKEEIEKYLAAKQVWKEQAMGSRRSFEDLKKLEDAESQPVPANPEEGNNEAFLSRVF